jgi:hypothetical protein
MLEEEIKNTNEETILRGLRISKRYSRAIHVLIIISKILIICSGLLSFSSTKFENIWILTFLSGSLNFLATSLLSYSNFLILERKKMIKNMNSKLEQLDIRTKLLISETDSDKST